MAKFTLRVNRKKWPKYTTRVICGLSIFFFRKVMNIIMRECAIIFIESVLNQLPKKWDEKTFFSNLQS